MAKVMSIDDTKRLALAVVQRAVQDWRDLCNGKEPTRDCNFAELERFFKIDCELYLQGTDLQAKKIYQLLLYERAMAYKKGDVRFAKGAKNGQADATAI